jgi:hypothetical protein
MWQAIKKGRTRSTRRFSSEMKKASTPPSVVRTYAPMGQTSILREWSTHDHLSASSAISPGSKLWLHDLIIIWDGAPFITAIHQGVPGRQRGAAAAPVL